ncbi:hypothetical protein B0H34DRAFT_702277 [Crassisporium funariophilum]|nr:hypothetical protein B0H34DRAFT_702277 [Crassisporium funariophilum]
MKIQSSVSMNPIAFLLLLSQFVWPVLAGVVCFQACTVECCMVGVWAFANPLGIAVGVTGCAGVCMVACATLAFVPPACFASDTAIATVVSVPNVGNSTQVLNRPISEVHVGDEVLTMVDGKQRTTRIVHNIHSKGDFDFFEFELVRAHPAAMGHLQAVSTRKLKVTPQHSMLLVDAMGEGLYFADAEDVRIGDKMKTGDGSAWQVSNIHQSRANEKYTLVTSEGSVLASGVLVSTICDEAVGTGQKLDDVLPDWKSKHRYELYTQNNFAVPVLSGA